MFSYYWNYTAGHFPQMLKLAKDSDYDLAGFSSLKADAPESRQHLILVQQPCFGDDFPIVDINALFKKPILDTQDILKFFVDQNLFDISQALSAGDFWVLFLPQIFGFFSTLLVSSVSLFSPQFVCT